MLHVPFWTVLPFLSTTASAQFASPDSTSNQSPSSSMLLCSSQVATPTWSTSVLVSPSANSVCSAIPNDNTSSVQYRGMNIVNQSPTAGKGWKDTTDWWVAFEHVNNMTRNLGEFNNTTDYVTYLLNMIAKLENHEYVDESLNAVRLYSTTDGDTQHLANALQSAGHRNLSIHAGVWSGGDEHTDRFAAEKDALDRALSQHGCDHIVAVSIGNEDLYSNLSTEYTGNPRIPLTDIALLVSQTQDIRSVLDAWGCCNVKVTHTDTFGEWLKTNVTEPLIKEVDFLTVNIFPYWEGKSIDEANATFWTHLESVKDMAQQYGKGVWVGETGWPASGPTRGSAVPSPENLQRYWNEVGCGLMKQDNFFWYAEWDELNALSFGMTKANGHLVITGMSCN